MLFLVLWFVLAVIGWAICFAYVWSDWDELALSIGVGIGVVCTVIFIIALVCLPISHTIDTQMLEDRPKLVEKLERTDLSVEERAQLVLDVKAFNDDLAHKQVFYPRNRVWFGWYHNEEVLTLKPIPTK